MFGTELLHTARAILLHGNLPRIQLDMLHPDPANVVRKHQKADKERFDAHAQERHLSEKDEVSLEATPDAYDGKLWYYEKPDWFPMTSKLGNQQNIDTLINFDNVNMPKNSKKQEIQDYIVSEFDYQQSPCERLEI